MRRKLLIIGIVCILLTIFTVFFIARRKNITGTQWYEKQEEYMDSFELISDDMDNAVALYVSGTISTDDFLTHIYIIQTELNVLKADYDGYLKQHPVKIGSYSYYEKSAVDAVESLFGVFQNILNMAQENADDPAVLSYEYIAYHQDIIKYVSKYVTAKNFIDGTFNPVIDVPTEESS